MSIMSKFTSRTLKKNKSRTIVTIIGIILSLSMFTAVTTSIVSLQNFILDVTKENDGDWHGIIYDLSSNKIEELEKSDEIDTISLLQGIGFAKLPESKNPDKQYIQVSQVNETFFEQMAVHLIEGKLPTNASEIIVAKQVNSTGQLNYKVGDTITLPLGTVQFIEGYTMKDNYSFEGVTPLEELIDIQEQTFTITGLMEKPVYESYDAPAFSAITLNMDPTNVATAFFTLEHPKTIYTFLEENYPNEMTATNSELLRFMGISGINSFNKVLYSMGAILIGIIMFGSISLIFNSFSISVAERTKNFGLLKSIGATKKQILNSVLYEASLLSLIGIPLGILAGLAGIGVTLELLQSTFSKILNTENSNVTLSMSIQWTAIIIAAIIGFITVLISAYIPARRAAKVNVISAIKQTNDIKLTTKQVRVSPLTKWLFGFEGTLASKYFKRNKKSYRATVVSIFMSIVLFISASSLTGYLSTSTDDLLLEIKHDLTYDFIANSDENYSLEDINTLFTNEDGITNFSYHALIDMEVQLSIEAFDKDYINYLQNDKATYNGKDLTINESAYVYFLEDEEFKKYIKENKLDENVYLNDTPVPLVYDFFKTYSSKEEHYLTFDMLAKNNGTLSYVIPKEIEDYTFMEFEIGEDGKEYARYYLTDEMYYSVDPYGNREYGYHEDTPSKVFLASEVLEKKQVPFFDVLDEKPFGIYSIGLTLVYPLSAYASVFNLEPGTMSDFINYYLASDTPYETYDKLNNILIQNNWDNHRLYNIHEDSDAINALLTIINVFCYGFITLISLIALANIFNTISTNILLRRREFAMLRSVGMTIKGVKKMLNLECLLYGFKGLLYGIPVSLGVSYLIYMSMGSGLNVSYMVPWLSILIAIVSVFVFVFGTMLYAMNQVKKDNPMETLRNENL